LNLCYLTGQGVERDEQQAFRWVRKSALAGFPDAVLALAWHYHNGYGVAPNRQKAELWYRKAARLKDPSAQFSLGQMKFDQGNYASALRWFRKGATQDHPRSQYYLGRMYLEGLGVRRDMGKAKALLWRAVTLRVPRAKKLLLSKRFKKLAAV
jgi:TPR repeat protein